MKKRLDAILIILAGVLWGATGVFVRYFGSIGFSSLQTVALRVTFTAVVTLISLLIYDRKLLKIKLKDIWCFLGTGTCGIMLFNFSYFKTISLTSLSVSAVLLYTSPIMVMFMSVFIFKEKITTSKAIACALALIGCVLVTEVLNNRLEVPVIAIVTGLLAALGYALYSIFSRFAYNRGYHPLTIIVYTFIITSIGILSITDMTIVDKFLDLDTHSIIMFILMGIITSVLPYMFFTMGLKRIEASSASIMASIEPVVATIIGVIVLKEGICLLSILGMLFVIASLVILNVKNGKAIDN